MKKTFNKRSGFSSMLFLFGLLFLAGTINAQTGTGFYGVTTSNQLVRFNSGTTTTTTTVGNIGGLQAGENIVGIDFRPANGQLYALGSSSRLYTINVGTGVATQVGTTGAFTLNGTEFGFDFNPTVDRIRVVSNTGQNLRLNPNDGALAATDPNLNPGTPQVTAAAYTNNFAGATTTTLYDIDTNNDTLYRQDPANAGTLVAVGALGVDASAVNGFDIASSNGSAFAALTVGGTTRLYSINLTTGAATAVGTIGTGTGTALRGLAIGFGTAASGTTALDFDGDRRADYSVFRLTNNTWYVNRSSNNSLFSVQFGSAAEDILTPGDYDGDGRADVAVWRPSNGTFYVLRSSDNGFQFVQFGQRGDEPVARDYDGDGRTDFAVVRRANNVMTWYILTNQASASFRAVQFGFASDVAAPGDYDGDGRFDITVYRGETGQPATFYVLNSGNNSVTVRQFGIGGDVVVPGDYNGDGRTDFAVVRLGSPYTWYILQPDNTTIRFVTFGQKPHYTAQADYDGDGRTDIAVWDPISGNFVVLRSSDNTASFFRFGQNGDYPVANYDTH